MNQLFLRMQENVWKEMGLQCMYIEPLKPTEPCYREQPYESNKGRNVS